MLLKFILNLSYNLYLNGKQKTQMHYSKPKTIKLYSCLEETHNLIPDELYIIFLLVDPTNEQIPVI